MEIQEAINKIWENKRYESESVTQVLSHLNEEVAESLKAMLKGDKIKAQDELEDALSCLLIALRMLDIDPDQAIARQIGRMQGDLEKTMHIYTNRVEIRVGDQVKGGWAIWSTDDMVEAFKVAQEFNCKIIKEEDPVDVESYEDNDLELNNAKT
ncbi:MAG: hypothetical protein AB1782_08065 [Cyanobacteriota bacterium]